MTEAVSGLLNIDKPAGVTSHDVVNRLRRLTGIRRIGHAGTLDPLATGVLLLCIGRATRLLEYLTGQDKTYRTTIRLGQTTDTYDADGEIIAEAPLTGITPDTLMPVLAQFRGAIEQVPPMYSAIKKDGQPLYKLARQGVEVDRPARAVNIQALTLCDWQPPYLTLEVDCSSGTYIRSLAYDIGAALGCGGHVATLRRCRVGLFAVDTSHSLDDLTGENWPDSLQPADAAVAHLPEAHLPDTAVQELWQGRGVPATQPLKAGALVRIYDEAGAFAGLVQTRAGVWRPHKMFPPV